MATQPTGDEPWKLELAELKTALQQITDQLAATKPVDLTDLSSALDSLRSELSAIKAELPDSKAAASLVANLEAKLLTLSETVAALPPPPKSGDAPPVPPTEPEPKQKRTWV